MKVTTKKTVAIELDAGELEHLCSVLGNHSRASHSDAGVPCDAIEWSFMLYDALCK